MARARTNPDGAGSPLDQQAEGAEPILSNAILDERTPKLIFELFNDILISLPARECVAIEREPMGSPLRASDAGQLCFVDWRQARTISGRDSDTANLLASNVDLRANELDKANLYLDESSFAHQRASAQGANQMIEEQAGGPQALVSDLLRRLASSNRAHHHSTFSPLNAALDGTNSQLSRLTYLSAGSLLSLVGIITNLLILLIIFINTKQKCHNILGRGQTSHTNYHHLLLFQLTLTGLLLGGYILIDNINLYNGLTNNSNGSNSDLQHDARERPPFSPLSIYLPPTPFHLNPPDAASIAHSATTHDRGEEELSRPQRPAAAAASEISAFVIYLEARRRQQGRRVRRRLHHVSPASLVLVSCRASARRQSWQLFDSQNETPSEDAGSGTHTAGSTIDSTQMLFNVLASVHLWTVVALAYDRYCAIAHPLEYLRSINDTKARTFLVVLWSAALLMNVFLPWALESKLSAPGSRVMGANQSIGRFQITGQQLERNLDGGRAEGQYQCLGQRVAPEMDIREDADVLEFVHFLIGLSARHAPSDSQSSRGQHASLALGLSLLTFLLIILSPLIIITVCNVRIYSIVKVHERRMSVSSGSQGAGYVGIGALGSSASSSLGQGRCLKRDSLLTNNTELANERSETCSIGSSILGKLIRASAQVGAMGSILISSGGKEETSSQCSSSNEQEICRLIGNSGESCKPPVPPASSALSSHYLPDSKCFMSKLAANEPSLSPSPSFVSRLTRRRRRLISLHQQQQQQKPTPANGPDLSNANSRSVARETSLKKKLKRKLSDKEQAGGAMAAANSQSSSSSRKSSFAPSEQAFMVHESAYCSLASNADNCSCQGQQFGAASARLSRQQQQQQLQADSDGIMRQLKMAGLSFAGIAISELMATPPERSRTLHRSSSWSLGNMNSMTNNRQQPHQLHLTGCIGASHTRSAAPAAFQFCEPTSRDVALNNQPAAKAEQQAPPVKEKRHSYVSLMLNQQQRDIWQEKFCTKLLFDSDSESHGQPTLAGCPRNSHQQQHQQQYFNLGGTKSVAFNVVVWLMLLMLTFSLPLYSLLTIDQILQVGSRASDALGDRLRSNLTLLDELIETGDESPSDPAGDKAPETWMGNEFFVWLRAASIWFDCICRLLFLLMLPLNGWLYGIRSRSLRTTLKMVLKRYISKKQASIEINQRRKSVVSTRSRDSSVCCNAGGLQQATFCPQLRAQNCCPGSMITQQQQQREFPNGRVFRRCSSFNLPPQTRQDYFNSINEANERDREADRERQARRSHNSSIRFVLSDEDRAESRADKRQAELDSAEARAAGQLGTGNGIAGCLLPIPSLISNRHSSSQTSSLDSSSLASSHRSLLSASIQSSQSAALLLLDQRNFHSDGQQWAPTRGQPPASRPARLTGVLKKRGAAAQMRRQESSDSATSAASRPSPSSTSGVLKKTSTSTKSILAQQPHHPTSGLNVSFGRTQSLDRDNSFELALNHARQAVESAEHSSMSTSASVARLAPHHRMRKTPAIMAPPPPPAPANSVETDESKHVAGANDDSLEAQLFRSQLAASRRPSSDIKFMLTSAGDQAETKLLLDVQDQQVKADANEAEASECREENMERRVEAQALDLLKDADRQFEQILLSQNASQRIAYKLDYYKQLKLAISKYFFSLKRRPLSSSSSSGDESGLCDERRSKLLRQSSDITSLCQGEPADGPAPPVANLSDKCERGHLCGCCPASQVANFSLAHGSSRLRRNSLDSNTHKLALLQQQLECQSARIETTPHATHTSSRAVNRSASNQSISSNGSTKSDQLQLRQQQQKQPAQSSHLKPPNFLKLIFEPEAQGLALYSSSLALSPIKECSSNHSWASSQSSLATSNGHANGLQRKSSAASGNESAARSLLDV